MKKLFALLVLLAAFTAVGCAEKTDTMPPPAEDAAAPAEDEMAEPADEPAQTP